MPQFIDDTTFGDYFREFEHTAWRLETRRGYASDRQGERYAQFLRGDDLPVDLSRPWAVNVQARTAAGARFERVRVVDVPPTNEQRFLLVTAVASEAAGEDIRHLWRPEVDKLALPAEDFWLFDSRRALLLHFDEGDEYLGAELIEDPALIVRYCQIRDAAWHYAVRREEFAEQVLSRM